MKVEYSRIDGHAFIYITYRYDTIFNVVRFLHLFPVNKQTKRHVFAALLWRIYSMSRRSLFAWRNSYVYVFKI